MISPNPVPCEHVVFTDFDGVEGILVDLNTKKYYQLNETAMLIWKGLERGLALKQIAEEIVAGYEVTDEDALRNVDEIVGKFQMYSLVRADDGD
jgi:Coenzyme PQQ synthesis protein D (PqqD)